MPRPFQTDERRAFRDQVIRFAKTELVPHINEWDEAGAVPWELHQKVGALGIYGFGIDEKWGGLGFDDAFMRVAWAEEVARRCSSGVMAAVGGRGISLDPIVKLADDETKARILPDVIAGRTGSSLAITEPSGGSDVAGLRTKAVRDGNHWVISGQKAYITGGMKSDHFVVAARTGGAGIQGVSLFLVPSDAPGFSRIAMDRKQGWWCAEQALLTFDEARVPATAMLGEENKGFISIMSNFNLERLTLIAQSLGMMKGVLDQSIDWAQQRETFGKPLIKHQVIRHKIAEMSARVDALESWVDRLCWEINEGEMPVAGLAKAKFHATKSLEYCASEGMQIMGGAGYMRGNLIERVWREVKIQAIGGGSEEIMRDLAVRQMGL
ncbi:MAG: acyl-CoA dehydrogenase family protein [Pseudomonadota bacterium]|nr:acyl-CoA dehydrogenase family protein [Pseudomonadota bacterium]MEE3100592.1 acyl-CoA dehydrogenase family protein [Pseudomonadota bacterium]